MKYKFEVDEKGKSFTFADMEFSKYGMMYKAVEACYKGGVGDIPKKAVYDKFMKKYDIPPKTFMKIHNGIMTRLWLDPVRQYSKYLAFRGVTKKPIPHLLTKVHEQLPMLKQADEDGIRNVTPILFALGVSPKEAKGILGKSLWKRLCKNSFTRNNHISKLLGDLGVLGIKETCALLDKFPSTLLAMGRNLGFNTRLDYSEKSLWVIKTNKKTYGRYSGCADNNNYHLDIYRDTRNMSVKLGTAFSNKWDFPKMENKHAEYTDLINKAKYSSNKFPVLDKSNIISSFSHGEYEATLLDNPKAIADEGTRMKHCVGSYVGRVADGRYLVYSITKDGKRSSTLGVRVEKTVFTNTDNLKLTVTKYSFSQHYGHCNQRITCENELIIAQRLIEKLNKLK